MPDAAPVLIVDDNVDLADNLREILEEEGFVCRVAASGEEALQVLEHQQVGLVLTDLRMDGLDGLAVIRHVRSRFPQTPVMLMTAYAREQTVDDARKEGAAFVLRKPFPVDELLQLIKGH